MEVLVFATNVTEAGQVSRVQALLTHLPAVTDWNFDLDDRENILRVVARDISPRYIERLLEGAGVSCCELE
ncbi:MAG: hypothetical protein EOP51_19440 [Sphingobacteriales bacterium]|nr:MAG: hypothetical protein EOP51_19440 [Sphingobacteriales bacterium]